ATGSCTDIAQDQSFRFPAGKILDAESMQFRCAGLERIWSHAELTLPRREPDSGRVAQNQCNCSNKMADLMHGHPLAQRCGEIALIPEQGHSEVILVKRAPC